MSETKMMLVLAITLLHHVQLSLQAWIHHGELNLARNQVASQSSTYGGFNASLAVNGDGRDYAQTADGRSSWWKVDLTRIRHVTSVVVQRADEFLLPFRLLSSTATNPGDLLFSFKSWDGVVYQNGTTNHLNTDILRVKDLMARHIALYSQTNVGLKLAEVEIYGANANLAFNKSTNQSGQLDSIAFPSHLAVNGYYMDHSQTLPVAPAWWQVDMSNRYGVTMIRLHPGKASNDDFLSPVLSGVSILTSTFGVQDDYSLNSALWETIADDEDVFVFGKAIEFYTPKVIRSIAVALMENESLTISELEVFTPFNLAQLGLIYQSDGNENSSSSQNFINGIHTEAMSIENPGVKWWRVNLVDVYVISKIRIYGKPKAGAVFYSKNQTITDLSHGPDGWNKLTHQHTYGVIWVDFRHLSPVEVRHIAVVNINESLTMSEVRVQEHNYALSQQTFSDGSSASLAVDGNLNTYSTTNTAGGQWWMVDIGHFIYFTTAFIYVRKGVCTDTDGELQDCSQRLSDVQILTKELSSDAVGSFGKEKGWKLCFQYDGSKGDSFWVQCYEQHWLRQLAITAKGVAMELREVEVYGKELPQLGHLEWSVTTLDDQTLALRFKKWTFEDYGYHPPDRYKVKLENTARQKVINYNELTSERVETHWRGKSGDRLIFQISCEVRGQQCGGPVQKAWWYTPQDSYTAGTDRLYKGVQLNLTCNFYAFSEQPLRVRAFGLFRRDKTFHQEHYKFCSRLRGDVANSFFSSSQTDIAPAMCLEGAERVGSGQVATLKFNNFVLNKTGIYTCTMWLNDFNATNFHRENPPVLQIDDLNELACPAPPNGQNTQLVPPTRRFAAGFSFTHSCLTGYTFSGERITYTCLENGSWDTQEISNCKIIICLPPPNGEKTVQEDFTTNFTYKQTYTYTCIKGYTSDISPTVMCEANGKWSSPPPICGNNDVLHIMIAILCILLPLSLMLIILVVVNNEKKLKRLKVQRQQLKSGKFNTEPLVEHVTRISPTDEKYPREKDPLNQDEKKNEYLKKPRQSRQDQLLQSDIGYEPAVQDSGYVHLQRMSINPERPYDRASVFQNGPFMEGSPMNIQKSSYTFGERICFQIRKMVENIYRPCIFRAELTKETDSPDYNCTKPPDNTEMSTHDKTSEWNLTRHYDTMVSGQKATADETHKKTGMTLSHHIGMQAGKKVDTRNAYTRSPNLPIPASRAATLLTEPAFEDLKSNKHETSTQALHTNIQKAEYVNVEDTYYYGSEGESVKDTQDAYTQRGVKDKNSWLRLTSQGKAMKEVDSNLKDAQINETNERNTENIKYATFHCLPKTHQSNLYTKIPTADKARKKSYKRSSHHNIDTQAGKKVETSEAYTRPSNLPIPVTKAAELITEPAFVDLESNKHEVKTGALNFNMQKADYTTAEGTYYYGSEVEPVKHLPTRLSSKTKAVKKAGLNLNYDKAEEASSKDLQPVRKAKNTQYKKFDGQSGVFQSKPYIKIPAADRPRKIARKSSVHHHLSVQVGNKSDTSNAYTRAPNLPFPVLKTAELFTDPALVNFPKLNKQKD